MGAATKGQWHNVNPVKWPKGISVLLNPVVRGAANEAFFCVSYLTKHDGSKAKGNYRIRFYFEESTYVAQRKLALKHLAEFYQYKRVPAKWSVVSQTFKGMLTECGLGMRKHTFNSFYWKDQGG